VLSGVLFAVVVLPVLLKGRQPAVTENSPEHSDAE